MAAAGKSKKFFRVLEDIYEDAPTPLQPPQKHNVSKSLKAYLATPGRVEKILSVSVLFFGLAALALGLFQFRSNIFKHFLPQEQAGSAISLTNQESELPPDLLGLRQKDTDQDGLSDYDELYIYSTSPYLPDTDSDGISDQQEIARQTDPNCPEEQDCFLGVRLGGQTSIDDILLSNQFGFSQLRQVLLESGLSQERLDELSNDELFFAYQQVILENQLRSATSSPIIALRGKDPSELTPSEIRILLRGAGVDQAALDAISDEELLELVNEILQPVEE